MNLQAMAPIPILTTTTTTNEEALEGAAKGHFLCPNPECGKTFGTRAGLRYHQKNSNRPGCGHVGGETLAQAESDGKDKDEDTPKKKRASGEGGEFKCTIDGCDKSYTTKAGLRYHATSHHGIPKLTKEQRDQLKKKRRKEKRAAKQAEVNGQAASSQHQAQQQAQQTHQAAQQIQQQQHHQQQQQQAAQAQMQNPHQAYGYAQGRQPAMDYYAKPTSKGDESYPSAFQNIQQPSAQDYQSYAVHQSYNQSAAQKHQQNAQYYPQQTQPQTQGGNLTQMQLQLQQSLQNTAYTSNPGELSAPHLQPLNQFNKNYQYYPQQQQQQAPQMAAANPISSFLNTPAANGNHVWTSQIQGNSQAYAQSNAPGVAQMRQQNVAPNAYAPVPVPQWGSTNASYLAPQVQQRK